MTVKLMGDATHANVGLIADVNLQMVAGYVTGSPDIRWTDADWARFPGIPHIRIDQGFGDTRALDAHAFVFDVEAGAFSPADASRLIDASRVARPTIYCNRSNLSDTIVAAMHSHRWRGDIWLAFPNWDERVSSLPPIPAGCRFVAIQARFLRGFDLSVVLDSSWPLHAPPPNFTEEIMRQLPTVHPGSQGNAVRRVQALANVATGGHIAIDGVYGPQTENAVKSVQGTEGLTVDGIVGHLTWQTLLGV